MGRWGGDKGWLDTGPGPLANCQMISKGSGNIVTRGRLRERDAGETNNSLSALKCQDRSTLFMDPCLK